MTLESATVYSVNTVYAQVIHQLGAGQRRRRPPNAWACGAARRSREPRTPLLPYDSAVLGTNEVNTLEMASAYGTLATGGQHVDPDARRQHHRRPGQRDLAGPRRSPSRSSTRRWPRWPTTSCRRSSSYGTGKAANIGRPQIGKTGTGADHTNAWFVGAVPQLVAVGLGRAFTRATSPWSRPRTRITVFGGTWPARDLAALHDARDRGGWLPVRDFPTPAGRLRVGRRRRRPRIPTACRTRYTLPPNIQHGPVHPGHASPRRRAPRRTKVQSVPVPPSVIGMDQSEASAALEEAGFNVQVEMATSTQPGGHGDLSEPARRHLGPADHHGHDHGRLEPESERLAFGRRSATARPLGGPGFPFDTNALPALDETPLLVQPDAHADADAGGDRARRHRIAPLRSTHRARAPGRCRRQGGPRRAPS